MSANLLTESGARITQNELSVLSDAYKKRRRQQMLRFFGATTCTLLCARMAFRGVIARKYVPNMFQLNHKPPLLSSNGDALGAFAYGSGLAISGFAMFATGTCWIADVSTFPEFALKAKRLMGDTDLNSLQHADASMQQDTEETLELLDSIFQDKRD